MNDQVVMTIVGCLMAVGLMGAGGWLGFRAARNRSIAGGVSQEERNRLRHLLLELGTWTSEYSGSVSDYQDQLGEIREIVATQGNAPSATRVLLVLQQIMSSNEQLTSRLDAAEKQLDQQTRQLESYLTEARTDGLTGLANRRAFDQKIDEVFAKYVKGGRSFVVALIDIDKFKNINDTHGHQIGDQVLQRLAASLSQELASAMIVARFGGEEFVIIMNGPIRMAADRMNEVRGHFESQRIEVGSLRLKVTISVGLSEPQDDLVAAPIIRRADECLYAAKNIGRNRVYFHDGNGPALVGAPELAQK